MLNYDDSNPPTCNVVVSKDGEQEVLCGSAATQLISLTDPDHEYRLLAVVLLCDAHDRDLDAGKNLLIVGENNSRIVINSNSNKEGRN